MDHKRRVLCTLQVLTLVQGTKDLEGILPVNMQGSLHCTCRVLCPVCRVVEGQRVVCEV